MVLLNSRKLEIIDKCCYFCVTRGPLKGTSTLTIHVQQDGFELFEVKLILLDRVKITFKNNKN